MSCFRLGLLLAGVYAFGAVSACSNSQFTGTSADKKSAKDKNDDGDAPDGNDTDDKNGAKDSGGDDSTGIDDLSQTEIDAFANGDQPIAEDDHGIVKQRFSPTESKTPIDIVFVIDMSGSMGEEVSQVQTNLGAFLTKLEGDPRSKQAQVIVMAGTNDQTFVPPASLTSVKNFDFQASNHSIDSHNLLAVAQGFLDGTIPAPKLKPRDKAVKHLIFISDDDANKAGDGNPAAIFEPAFRTFLTSKLPGEGQVVIHTISCPVSDKPCAHKSQAYMNLANDAKYKGVVEDLRSSNWGPIFDTIADSVTTKAKLTFDLSKKPVDSTKIAVYVNGKKTDDFTYDTDANEVTLKLDEAKDVDKVVIVYSTT